MEHLIRLESVCKIYRSGETRVDALKNLSLTVDCGEFVAIVGTSGSGKSTLMHLLGCLDLPDSGEYFLENRSIAALREQELAAIRNRTIGFIFQGFHLIPGLNAIENVELPLSYRGIPRSRRRQIAIAALVQVGLGSRLHHFPAQLSGGQQQRVAIARAIAGDPPLILADEPTGNLDSASGSHIMELLLSLHRAGKTLVLITHDPAIAALAPRILQIRDGCLLSDRERPS